MEGKDFEQQVAQNGEVFGILAEPGLSISEGKRASPVLALHSGKPEHFPSPPPGAHICLPYFPGSVKIP